MKSDTIWNAGKLKANREMAAAVNCLMIDR